MRVHLLALPNAQTTEAYSLDGFSQMTIRMATVLKRLGHTVFLYASEENEAPCDELVTCITKAEQDAVIQGHGYQNAVMTAANPLWAVFNPRAIEAIGKRKQPRDLIFTIGGNSQATIYAAHPELMDVEYSIGYPGNCCRYRVYESRAWQHYNYGAQSINNVRFFDDVIPGFFDETKLPFVAEATQPPYVAYVGRLVPRKGLVVACDAARLAGVPLKVVGHGDAKLITYGDYLGPLDNAGRNDIIAHASAVLCPTVYVEPFNCVGVEAQMCGTPVISTDLGGFTETIAQGVSGFRCSYLGEFVDAIKGVGMLDRAAIRDRAVALYGMDAACENYARYLERLALLWDKGWNTVGG